MLKHRKIVLLMACFFFMIILCACGFDEENNKEIEGETVGDSTDTVLAGQGSPEIVGVIKGIEANEVIVTVEGQDVTYRLSEDAKRQIEAEKVDIGNEITFTTYSIGDRMETIDRFIIK